MRFPRWIIATFEENFRLIGGRYNCQNEIYRHEIELAWQAYCELIGLWPAIAAQAGAKQHLAISPEGVNSSGQWLRPLLLGAKSIPTSVT